MTPGAFDLLLTPADTQQFKDLELMITELKSVEHSADNYCFSFLYSLYKISSFKILALRLE